MSSIVHICLKQLGSVYWKLNGIMYGALKYV